MALLKIITVPDPVLKRKAHKVTDFGKDFQALVKDMVETMREAPGVGLAAPQVGVSSRLIVVECAENEEEDEDAPKKMYVVINPEIDEASEDMELGVEGCLSVPRMMGEVNRHLKITVKGLNRQGKPIKLKLQGWLARIFQHEIDHLEGILYTDRATKLWRPADDEEVQDNV